MSENKNILLCGVGGQGTILASKILSYALVEAGYDVKMSEIHGMSQRGGSVTTQVRYGKKVYSPIIGQGSADILVSFVAMEAYRYLEILNPKGFAVGFPALAALQHLVVDVFHGLVQVFVFHK